MGRINWFTENTLELIRNAFNGNLLKYKMGIDKEYINKNDIEVDLVDAESGETTQTSLAQYLDINFYSWKNRVVEYNGNNYDISNFMEQFATSLDKVYCLVEENDAETTPSQEIDISTISGQLTFMCVSNKIKNLDYYCNVLRNAYMGVFNDLLGDNGQNIRYVLSIGKLLYENEPTQTQFGEAYIVNLNFAITILPDVSAYSDYKFEYSLDGKEYTTLNALKITMQNIFTSTPLTQQNQPANTGFIASSCTKVMTISYYNFKGFADSLDKIFFDVCSIETQIISNISVNIPIWVKITRNANTDNEIVSTYLMMIDSQEKAFENNDIVVNSISLKNGALR